MRYAEIFRLWKISISHFKRKPCITVKEVNIHKSTKSCQKVNNPCRFSFPRLPSDKTLISNPLPEEDLSKKAYNLISTTLSEEELSKEIINLIYYPSSEKDLGKDVFTEKLNDAKNIL